MSLYERMLPTSAGVEPMFLWRNKSIFILILLLSGAMIIIWFVRLNSHNIVITLWWDNCSYLAYYRTGLEVIKTFFTLISAEHEIFSANMKIPIIVGIFIFISR